MSSQEKGNFQPSAPPGAYYGQPQYNGQPPQYYQPGQAPPPNGYVVAYPAQNQIVPSEEPMPTCCCCSAQVGLLIWLAAGIISAIYNVVRGVQSGASGTIYVNIAVALVDIFGAYAVYTLDVKSMKIFMWTCLTLLATNIVVTVVLVNLASFKDEINKTCDEANATSTSKSNTVDCSFIIQAVQIGVYVSLAISVVINLLIILRVKALYEWQARKTQQQTGVVNA